MKYICGLLVLPLLLAVSACNEKPADTKISAKDSASISLTTPSLIILGTVQDAGSPQIGCKKDCCRDLFANPDKNRKVVSLGLIDPQHGKTYIFEATPDLPEQMKNLRDHASFKNTETPDGIFLTHAHIGHYSGLMYLGKEAMNADSVRIFAMPRMKNFLEHNGPWDQLVRNKNISIEGIDSAEIRVTESIKVIPFKVPHRDEYSETAGYIIAGPNKKALFIPDIDKWEKWGTNIIDAISKVDYAFIDATFYDGEEIQNRDISQIPHPFVIESMEAFKGLSAPEKSKVFFIHFNHTNPLLNPKSIQAQNVIKQGFNIATIDHIIEL